MGIDFDPGALGAWHQRGVLVVYGDMADPAMHVQLLPNTARRVISTVRAKEMSLALIHPFGKKVLPASR